MESHDQFSTPQAQSAFGYLQNQMIFFPVVCVISTGSSIISTVSASSSIAKFSILSTVY